MRAVGDCVVLKLPAEDYIAALTVSAATGDAPLLGQVPPPPPVPTAAAPPPPPASPPPPPPAGGTPPPGAPPGATSF